MGAFASTEVLELPDLSIDVDLDEDAKLPTYESAGRAGLSLYASEDVVLNANEKTRIPTGVRVRLPFMLVGMVVGPDSQHIDVTTEMVDFDSTTPLFVNATFRPAAQHAESGVTRVGFKKGDKIAMLVILPIARPGLCVSRPARNDDEAVVAAETVPPRPRIHDRSNPVADLP